VGVGFVGVGEPLVPLSEVIYDKATRVQIRSSQLAAADMSTPVVSESQPSIGVDNVSNLSEDERRKAAELIQV
jgi:hypothetical protein